MTLVSALSRIDMERLSKKVWSLSAKRVHDLNGAVALPVVEVLAVEHGRGRASRRDDRRIPIRDAEISRRLDRLLNKKNVGDHRAKPFEPSHPFGGLSLRERGRGAPPRMSLLRGDIEFLQDLSRYAKPLSLDEPVGDGEFFRFVILRPRGVDENVCVDEALGGHKAPRGSRRSQGLDVLLTLPPTAAIAGAPRLACHSLPRFSPNACARWR